MLSLLALALAASPAAFVPPPAEQVRLYSATPLKAQALEGKSLRELSILRNTVYARYGWDGYRKPWLRDYFHSQTWFRPNPQFSYRLLGPADKANVHAIGLREQGFTSGQLKQMRDDLLARRGQLRNDIYRWRLPDGREVQQCTQPRGGAKELGCSPTECLDGRSRDCQYLGQKGYQPDPNFTEAKLSAQDKIELGLISRGMGEFALDEDQREKREQSLDALLKVADLRQLSLRDLRILRNTIYARRGRAFKSQALQRHFTGLDWYAVDPSYTEAKLTPTDRRNVALVKSVEDEFGGPLSDEDWLTEPAVDGA